MDRKAIQAVAEKEIEFLVSLLRISYPGEPASRESDALEQMLVAKASSL